MTGRVDLVPLIAAIGGFYARDPAGIAMLAAAARRLGAVRAEPMPPAAGDPPLPVCRHLAALRAEHDGTDPAVAVIRSGFLALAPDCRWRQNPNYVARPPDPAFLASYGYVELVGPAGHVHDPEIAVGFLLLGPTTHYPEHVHPAEEVYHPIAGDALWWRDRAPWARVPSGAPIHHPPMLAHATRTEASPLLALYCWSGEIATAARITAPSPR